MKIYNKIIKCCFILLMGITILCMNVAPRKIEAATYQEKVQEYRAVWVSHFVGDIPAYTSEEKYKADFNKILDNMEAWGFNAMVFHVRTHNNALYKSELNPIASWWSKVNFDEFDPLEWSIQACHDRGIEFHAWMNPYRITTSGSYPSNSYETKYPEGNPGNDPSNFITVGDSIILDPGIPSNRDFIVDTCMELVENYNVDAIHFDDYFYISGSDDTATRAKYNKENLSIGDFRRKQVDLFIEQLHNELSVFNKENNRAVELGISPSGVYRNGSYPAGTTPTYDSNGSMTYPTASNTGGFAHYGDYLYSDTKHWIDQEWIDYITPQTYHSIDNQYSGFAKLAEWWNWCIANKKVNLSMGIGIYMAINNSGGWDTADELENQFKTVYSKEHIDGVCMYKYGSLLNTSSNMVSHVNTINSYWNKNIPSVVKPQHTYLPEPLVTNITENGTTLSWDIIDNVRGYMVWRVQKGAELDITNSNHLYIYTQDTQVNIETGYDYYISSVNLANEISEPMSSNQASNVERIINQISAIKFPITLEDEAKINNILTRYNLLSNEEKNEVTNYSVLETAINHIQVLKEIDVDAKAFAETLKTDVLDNYLLPLTYKDYSVSWSYSKPADSSLYSIESGDVLVEYLATTLVPLKYTLTKNGINYVGVHNLNIGYVKQSEIGLFYRNTPNSMNSLEDSSANVSFIGWSGKVLEFKLNGINYKHFLAIGNVHDFDSNDIPEHNWTSCGNLYTNVGTTSITATGKDFYVYPQSNYGYFIIGADGVVRYACNEGTEAERITLNPGESIYTVRYLDGMIEGSPIKPGGNIVVGTKVNIVEPSWTDENTDQAIANQIIQQINSIQTPITLSQKDLIERCEKLYSDASQAVKALVTNYSSLVTARLSLDILIEESAVLNAHKESAKNIINNHISNLSDYSTNNQSMISSILSLFETELENSLNEDDINNLVNKYKNLLDEVPTIEEEEAQIIVATRDDAIKKLTSYISDLTVYSEHAINNINNIISRYTDAINASKTTAAVADELAKAFTELNGVKTILDEAKESYINYLNDIYDSEFLVLYSTSNQTSIRAKIVAAKNNINKAKTVEAIANIVKNLEEAINDIPTKAKEEEVLNKAIEEAIKELENYVNINNYNSNDKTAIASIIRQYKLSIQGSTKVTNINNILQEAKDALDQFEEDPLTIRYNQILVEANNYVENSGVNKGNNQLTTLFNELEKAYQNAVEIEDLDAAYEQFKQGVDDLVEELPVHEHVACPICGKCTAQDCTGSTDDKCAGHEVTPDKPNTPDTPGTTSCFGALYLGSTLLLMSLVAILIKRKH